VGWKRDRKVKTWTRKWIVGPGTKLAVVLLLVPFFSVHFFFANPIPRKNRPLRAFTLGLRSRLAWMSFFKLSNSSEISSSRKKFLDPPIRTKIFLKKKDFKCLFYIMLWVLTNPFINKKKCIFFVKDIMIFEFLLLQKFLIGWRNFCWIHLFEKNSIFAKITIFC